MVSPELLEAVLRQAAAGDPWYGSSTGSLLESLSAPQAAARPASGGHSVWEVLLHMTAWAREVERRLGGAEPAPPAEGDWPEVGDVSEAAWALAVEEFLAASARLGERIAAFDAGRWSERVGGERSPELGTGVTYAEMVLGALQHNAYHTGQIALLRKLAQSGERNRAR